MFHLPFRLSIITGGPDAQGPAAAFGSQRFPIRSLRSLENIAPDPLLLSRP